MQTLIKNTQAYRLFKAERDQNRFSHAYLLLMDDSRNLRATLKAFAKLVFHCDEQTTEQQKTLAKRIDEETFTDCLFYPDKEEKFVVDDAERLAEECVLKPVESDKKLFLVSDFADANVASQNKLLKLLEEPPEGVIFLLGATSVFPVLSTVLSRVSKLEILPFSEKQVVSALSRLYENSTYTKTDFELCAAASGGSVGAAQNMLEGGYYSSLLENAFSLALAEEHRLPQIFRTVGETKYKKEILSLLRLIFRDALMIKLQEEPYQKSVLLSAEKNKLQEVASRYSKKALLYAQEAISQAELEVQFNAVFPQCVEVCLAKIRKK
jgi:DNA polymerase-3 subunit delta'